MDGHTHNGGNINGNRRLPVTCWMLDTRKLWKGDNIWAAEGSAAALSLISTKEQNVVTGKMFMHDSRMSLASALLKRLYISKILGIAWQKVQLGRKENEKHGKPCALDERGHVVEDIDFNVSHQGGLVTLIGIDRRLFKEQELFHRRIHNLEFSYSGTEIMVGTDIVCVNERDDYRTIDQEGLDGWVDIYESIFSDEERWSMKYDCDYVTLLDGTILEHQDLGRHDRCLARNRTIDLTTKAGKNLSFSSELIIEAKLRRFYAFFCYKEAYIKLAGEALLAPWLKELEFFNVRSPRPGTVARCSTHGTWGELVGDVEVHLHGKPVHDVRMNIQSFEENFMISTAVQGAGVEDLHVPAFTALDLESDILAYATEQIKSSA